MQQICWRFSILQHTEKMKELTGDPKEAIRLTNGLFTAMFGGNKQQSENNSLLFTGMGERDNEKRKRHHTSAVQKS